MYLIVIAFALHVKSLSHCFIPMGIATTRQIFVLVEPSEQTHPVTPPEHDMQILFRKFASVKLSVARHVET
ncbi:hypothetical protein BU16DRAFT_528822 [Lophium mytilinum]|uniref:Secreted protein n=1 Tax=Lophium mytilinum TaxID=390894 RepID=A0A6A6QN49_9PEZI|nr:hypothetical protein BU16DRAFT_528822 [Lophium mytilinum]